MALRELATKLSLRPPLAYDGRQLAPHFLRRRFGLKGHGAVAFRGPCDVRGEALVDLADREAGLFIHSRDMLHFLVEIFGASLTEMILLQRLLAAIVADQVRQKVPPKPRHKIVRRGDDVFVDGGKLTVSIATLSPVSGLLHFGANVDTRETPVMTAGLAALALPPEAFAEGVLEALGSEVRGVLEALTKVCPAHPDRELA